MERINVKQVSIMKCFVKRTNTKYINVFVLYNKLFNSGCQLIDQLFLFKYFQSGSGERYFKGFKYFILWNI